MSIAGSSGDRCRRSDFCGRELEKIGPKTLSPHVGGWTTCLQPTPRWDFTSRQHGPRARSLRDREEYDSFRVKGVPLFWLPFIYYPIRTTTAPRLLLPTLGGSTYRGQAFSNAFFWAIDRSQDATFFPRLVSPAPARARGAEYRYVASPQSSGTVRFYRFVRNASVFIDNRQRTPTHALRGAQLSRLTATRFQTLSPHLIARARLDYFSDVVDQQLLHQTLYESSALAIVCSKAD
jgi:lipopolysaccharide assembly outer membrane protein LptD (OstA)